MDALSRRGSMNAASPVPTSQKFDGFGCPQISTLLSHAPPPEINIRASVLQAVAVMKRERSTGILVLDEGGERLVYARNF